MPSLVAQGRALGNSRVSGKAGCRIHLQPKDGGTSCDRGQRSEESSSHRQGEQMGWWGNLLESRAEEVGKHARETEQAARPSGLLPSRRRQCGGVCRRHPWRPEAQVEQPQKALPGPGTVCGVKGLGRVQLTDHHAPCDRGTAGNTHRPGARSQPRAWLTVSTEGFRSFLSLLASYPQKVS